MNCVCLYSDDEFQSSDKAKGLTSHSWALMFSRRLEPVHTVEKKHATKNEIKSTSTFKWRKKTTHRCEHAELVLNGNIDKCNLATAPKKIPTFIDKFIKSWCTRHRDVKVLGANRYFYMMSARTKSPAGKRHHFSSNKWHLGPQHMSLNDNFSSPYASRYSLDTPNSPARRQVP